MGRLMAPRLPKTIESEIFSILNESIDKGSLLSDIQCQSLVRKASKLNLANKYVCLSAIYTHAQKYEKAIESANNYFETQQLDEDLVDNVISALSNAKLFESVTDISKNYPSILNYSSSRYNCYEAALYILDIEHCDYIYSNYELDKSYYSFNHSSVKEYFENDKEISSRASQYFRSVFKYLTQVLASNKKAGRSLELGLSACGNYSSLELIVSLKEMDFETVLDIESQWLKKIAGYEVYDDKLCDIAFSMEL